MSKCQAWWKFVEIVLWINNNEALALWNWEPWITDQSKRGQTKS